MKNQTKIMCLIGLTVALSFPFGPAALAVQQNNVSIVEYSFNPANIQVNVGDTVVWTNNGQMSHTVTSNSGYELNSGMIYPANTYSHTFTSPGTFTYHCSIHPQMYGTITVGYGQQNNAYVQTTYATYISNFQATLNGTVSNYIYNQNTLNYVYFQWGTTTSYGSESSHQSLGNAGTFMQNIENLNSGTTYHFRAVAQGTNSGLIFGQDMTFTTTGSGNGNYGNSSLSMTKRAINLTSGNLTWSSSMNASPSDLLSFAITLQAGSQDVHNVVVRDVLPANLIYKGSLTSTAPYAMGGDITSGINIGTIYAGQTMNVMYQAQVAPAVNFSFGSTTLNNSATVTSSDAGTQTSTASVLVNKTLVYGASTVSTGLTNNFLTDSFFLPLLVIIAGLWLYFSCGAYAFADKLKSIVKK